MSTTSHAKTITFTKKTTTKIFIILNALYLYKFYYMYLKRSGMGGGGLCVCVSLLQIYKAFKKPNRNKVKLGKDFHCFVIKITLMS